MMILLRKKLVAKTAMIRVVGERAKSGRSGADP